MQEYKLRPIKFLWQLLNKTISEAKVYILGYRSYTVLLTQIEVDVPVVTVIDNTLGNIVWTRSYAGDYIGTLPGAFISATGNNPKVFIQNPVVFISETKYYSIGVADANSVEIQTSMVGAPGPTDDLLSNTPLEIRVYN